MVRIDDRQFRLERRLAAQIRPCHRFGERAIAVAAKFIRFDQIDSPRSIAMAYSELCGNIVAMIARCRDIPAVPAPLAL